MIKCSYDSSAMTHQRSVQQYMIHQTTTHVTMNPKAMTHENMNHKAMTHQTMTNHLELCLMGMAYLYTNPMIPWEI